MSTHIYTHDKYRLVVLDDSITQFAAVKSLKGTVEELVKEGNVHFILDFRMVSYLNSLILGALGDIYSKVNKKKGSVGVILKDETHEEIFDLSGMQLLIKVLNHKDKLCKTIDAAIQTEKLARENGRPVATVSTRDEFTVIHVEQELNTITNAYAFETVVSRLDTAECKNIILDFTDINMINSTAVSSIGNLFHKVRSQNGELLILANSEEIQNTLAICGLHKIIHAYSSLEDFFKSRKEHEREGEKELVLVVDDSRTMRGLLTKKLKKLGYSVITAENGKEAVKKALYYLPSLILMDITMPEMDGFEACRTIKEKVTEAYIPIIFVTGLREAKERLNAMEAGGDDYVNKPVQDEDLMFRLKAHLKIKELTEYLDTMNRNLESRVKEKTQTLIDIERQLYQAEKMSVVGTMLSGIAHELKNPLFIISGKAQQLLQKNDASEEEYRKTVEIIQNQVARSSTIVENMLKLVRRKVENIMRFDLNEIIANLKQNIDYLIANKPIEIKLDLPNSCPILCSATEIEQILINLVSNAIDAITERGTITIATKDMKEWWRLEVTDDGCGMSEEVRKKLFDPFYTTKEVGKGTGLGMSIVYRIVESHKGRISVQSEQGKGTTFQILFPKASG